jgi:hypothetical protein
MADRCSGGRAHVVPDVVRVRRKSTVEDPQEPSLKGVKPRFLLSRELADVLHVPTGIEKQMARIVRIKVHGGDEQLISPYAEVHYLGAPVSRKAEDASRRMPSSHVRHFVKIEEVSAVPHQSLLPGEDVGSLVRQERESESRTGTA